MTDLELAHSPVVLRPETLQPVVYTDLDFTIAADTARRLLEARPENTRKAYAHNWGQFERWCTDQGRIPLPATPQTLTEYLSRLIGISLSPATLSQVVGTIRSVHADAGYKATPDTRRALELLNDYRKEWAGNGNRIRKATPLLLDGLRAMLDTCDPETLAGARDRALLLLAFNMMARRSEVSGLDGLDLKPVGEGLEVYVKYSKTDQAARGVEVSVPYGQHAETCAVRAVSAWRDVLEDRGMDSGPFFRPIDRHGRIGGQEMAAGRQGVRLTGKSVSDVVRRRGLIAGLRETYTGHSIRSGAATSAYAAGVPVSVIAVHGRWSPNSPVMLAYIRAVDKWKNNPMKGIGL